MNDLDLVNRERTGTAVAPYEADPFASYGAQASTGQFLSFKNGEWLYGQDGEMLALGTHLVANMEGLRRGWRCWRDKNLVEDLTRLLNDRIPPERRADLGDNDKEMWERDKKTGQPIDPWVLTDILELANPDAGELYLYATSSKGGTNAIKRLCMAYSHHKRQLPEMLPIVELGNDSYMHKEWGKTYVPLLEVVGWTDGNAPSVTDAKAEQPLPENQYIDRNGEVAQKPGQRAANPTQGGGQQHATSTMTPISHSKTRF